MVVLDVLDVLLVEVDVVVKPGMQAVHVVSRAQPPVPGCTGSGQRQFDAHVSSIFSQGPLPVHSNLQPREHGLAVVDVLDVLELVVEE